jgi:asparagine synthase (glutamine-hydrolysing)
MATPDGRFVIVYNGALYNDGDLRGELGARGVQFRTRCDTETVLHAFATWGTEGVSRLRGMFAFAVYDTLAHTLTLARDPLGVKPLYWWLGGREIVFASEPAVVAAHPRVGARPNMAMVSAYLTTIRTTLGPSTLFEGVRALGAGQMALCDLGGARPVARVLTHWRGPAILDEDAMGVGEAAGVVRAAVTDSVQRHLRADTPVCALLSGGLDSTIVAALAAGRLPDLRTYCAGAPDTGEGDLPAARRVAEALGTRHSEAIVTREGFARDWPAMVARMGVPLSTPNEVAIHAVAQRLRADGCVVTLSGEGADEMLAGYEPPMDAAAAFVRARSTGGDGETSGGRFQLESNAWMPPDAKRALLQDQALRAAHHDGAMLRWFDEEFARCEEEVGATGEGRAFPRRLGAHLRFLRRVNLTGLLGRLDSATMLAGVEGRTPLADRVVADVIESLPMHARYAEPAMAGGGPSSGGGAGERAWRTKVALREAFRADVPEEVIARPKASFPLPFETWIADLGPALARSRFAREVFLPGAVEAVARRPDAAWRTAWPMINIALWGDRFWG